MSDKARMLAQIFNAADQVTAFWPLKNFIATNPLAGFEEQSFFEAVKQGYELFGGRGLPTRAMGQRALQEGAIKRHILENVLREHHAEALLKPMLTEPCPLAPTPDEPSLLNAHFIKYLSAFLDEGQAAWPMPHREHGFYQTWKRLAVHDPALGNPSFIKGLPDKPKQTLLEFVQDVPIEEREQLFARHFAALPGWSGFVKWRARHKHYPWQEAYPITLHEYLVVRFAMAKMLGDQGLRRERTMSDAQYKEGRYWLEAWERSYREKLFTRLQRTFKKQRSTARPDAQFVFCIDVRSEVFRRHLEEAGNFETLGFAGFFGVPIAHKPFDNDVVADSCPVLLNPQYQTTDIPSLGQEQKATQRKNGLTTMRGLGETLAALKKDLVAPYATVEALGAYFGIGMAAKTFIPKQTQGFVKSLRDTLAPPVKFETTVKKTQDDDHGLTLKQRVFHGEAALKIMGLTSNFAPFVFLAGHGSKTVNNPYASGLDCGACGGNSGGPNARVMAAILNDPDVRQALSERNIEIPADTVFIGAQHNTTTDNLKMFLPDSVDPNAIITLKKALEKAREGANRERMNTFSTARTPEVRANDWAEVRPEWGLAGNAAFIVGQRAITQDLNLKGRSFLHSYEWEKDTDGKILEIILTAPMVVGQWINSQYYFSTVDNGVYGSGSKTTHNVVGKIGVMQGNASDLMTGLPLQSVMRADGQVFHEPLRLQTIVHAPVERLKKVISEQDVLQKLFKNGWVSLVVIDPLTDTFLRYHTDGTFIPMTTHAPKQAPAKPARSQNVNWAEEALLTAV